MLRVCWKRFCCRRYMKMVRTGGRTMNDCHVLHFAFDVHDRRTVVILPADLLAAAVRWMIIFIAYTWSCRSMSTSDRMNQIGQSYFILQVSRAGELFCHLLLLLLLCCLCQPFVIVILTSFTVLLSCNLFVHLFTFISMRRSFDRAYLPSFATCRAALPALSWAYRPGTRDDDGDGEYWSFCSILDGVEDGRLIGSQYIVMSGMTDLTWAWHIDVVMLFYLLFLGFFYNLTIMAPVHARYMNLYLHHYLGRIWLVMVSYLAASQWHLAGTFWVHLVHGLNERRHGIVVASFIFYLFKPYTFHSFCTI